MKDTVYYRKMPGKKDAVWVIRKNVPDGHICAHPRHAFVYDTTWKAAESHCDCGAYQWKEQLA